MKDPAHIFTSSVKTNGTYGVPREVAVSNHIDLEKGETLRIVPPLSGIIPEWYWNIINDKKETIPYTAGVGAWVTKKGISMIVHDWISFFEFNLDSKQQLIWFDISAVDGVNANATMTYEGPGCGSDTTCKTGATLPKVLKTNIDAYDGNNDGCPYIMTYGSQATCSNPKFYPTTIDAGKKKPAWVIASDKFTKNDVELKHADIWKAAGSPDGLTMAQAPSGESVKKKAYHIWWSTNPVAQGWLKYLQNNAKGKTDAYGWAYDEKRWKTGDTFDVHGNPPDNKAVFPLVHGPNLKDTYLNIDILESDAVRGRLHS